MKTVTALLLCGLLVLAAALARSQDDDSTITGFVTRAVSASDFDVNGLRVLCAVKIPGTAKSAHGTTYDAAACPGDPPYVGEGMTVHYVALINEKTIYASSIDRKSPQRPSEVSGSAVIDAPPEAAGAQATGLTVRADGYRIHIADDTKQDLTPPLQSLADVKAGDWIKYKGKLKVGGVVEAASVEIGPNAIGSKEEALRAKKEYDPSAIPAEIKQNFLKDGFAGGCRGSYLMGCDPKRFPPFNDAVMQARVDKIGNSLVPAYQRALPGSDPAKIGFRFPLIDTRLFRDALTMPSGIILVPHQVVERTENDSQLAAVLADAIARALERQQYREQGKQEAAMASMLGGAFVPYAGGSIAMEGASAEGGILTHEQQQSGRVSLTLLHDAGYDIDQAPLAWWLLDPGKPEPLSKITLPDRAEYLYRILGEIWHNPAAGPAQAH
jgi:hypothetical protein